MPIKRNNSENPESLGDREINPDTLPDFVQCRLLEDCIHKGEIYPAGQANLPKDAFIKGIKEGWARESS